MTLGGGTPWLIFYIFLFFAHQIFPISNQNIQTVNLLPKKDSGKKTAEKGIFLKA